MKKIDQIMQRLSFLQFSPVFQFDLICFPISKVMGIVPSPIKTLRAAPQAIQYYHNQAKQKEGISGRVEWLSFFLTALTPIMGMGYFSSDVLYLYTQQDAFRETLTFGLFLLALALVPVLMIPYWAQYVIPFYKATVLEKLDQGLKCFCYKGFLESSNCLCYFFQCLFVVLIILPIFGVLTLGISVVILLLITFLKIDVWLLWIEAYRDQEWKMRAKVAINFRTIFQFVKDLLCVYINVVTSSYLMKWTPIAIVALCFKIVFIFKAIMDIVISFTEIANDYQKIQSFKKDQEQQKEEDERRKKEYKRQLKYIEDIKTKTAAEIKEEIARQKESNLKRQKQGAEKEKQKKEQNLLRQQKEAERRKQELRDELEKSNLYIEILVQTAKKLEEVEKQQKELSSFQTNKEKEQNQRTGAEKTHN